MQGREDNGCHTHARYVPPYVRTVRTPVRTYGIRTVVRKQYQGTYPRT